MNKGGRPCGHFNQTFCCIPCTWIFPSSPVLSILLATFTVLPHMSYCGFLAPMTPAITGPWFMPVKKYNYFNTSFETMSHFIANNFPANKLYHSNILKHMKLPKENDWKNNLQPIVTVGSENSSHSYTTLRTVNVLAQNLFFFGTLAGNHLCDCQDSRHKRLLQFLIDYTAFKFLKSSSQQSEKQQMQAVIDGKSKNYIIQFVNANVVEL